MAAQRVGPPNHLPRYRLLTGADDAAFCRRVSAALDLGYALYGSPAMTFNGSSAHVAQALLWPDTAAAKTGTRSRRRSGR